MEAWPQALEDHESDAADKADEEKLAFRMNSLNFSVDERSQRKTRLNSLSPAQRCKI